ncbi:MAG: hypothetical protein KDG52_08040 [Rhodocyclaceae bacterium]|nr:hypothetical protein [Rhodocyclaceae bacterium]
MGRGGVKPNHYAKPGPQGNTTGIVTPQTRPNASGPDNSAPPPKPAEEEKGWWGSWGSDLLHTGLDVVGLIPVVGEVADGANALIYLAEGDKVNAALSAASMLPVGGQAATAAKWGKKGVDAAAEVAERAAKEKLEREAAERAAREAEQRAAKEAEERAAKDGGEVARPSNRDGGRVDGDGDGGTGKKKKREPGPCDHLRQGNGSGPYRGGAHAKTSKPVGDGLDSHHMPADDASPLARNDGPAIQMDPADHAITSSNGRGGSEARDYRRMVQGLIENGDWRSAMALEILDVREVAKTIGEPGKYNEAMLEMLEYFKCLEKHGLLPNG